MKKIRKLFLMRESKELVTLVFDKGSFSLLADAGVSDDFSEKEILDLLDKLKVPSYADLITKAKSLKPHQVEFEMDEKDVKKLKLK